MNIKAVLLVSLAVVAVPAIATSGWIAADAPRTQRKAALSVHDVHALDAVMRLNTAIGLERGPLTTAVTAARPPDRGMTEDQAKTDTLLAETQAALRAVREPEIFRRAQDGRQTGSLLEIFRPPLPRSTTIASLPSFGTLGGNYTILTWLPTYLKVTHHLSVLDTGSYLAVNSVGSFAGYVISPHLTDWLGRRRTFVLMALCAAVTVGIYTMAPVTGIGFLLLGLPLGFFQSGIVAGIGATLAELFPTRVRATGRDFPTTSAADWAR